MNENIEHTDESFAEKENPPALQAFFVRAVTVQVICTAVILCGVIIIKSFFPALYPGISGFYRQSFTAETGAEEVLSGGDTDEI